MVAFVQTRRRTAVALGAAAVLVVGLTSVSTTGAAAHPQQPAASGVLPYQNPKLPISRRVSDLLGRMTLLRRSAR